MFKLAKILVGICSLLLFTEKVKAGPFETAIGQNACYYMDQGADFYRAGQLAAMAQFSLLNSNLVVPGYIRRNMNTIVAYSNANPNIGNEMDKFDVTYAMMQNCPHVFEEIRGTISLSEFKRILNNCLQDKEWCRKYMKM